MNIISFLIFLLPFLARCRFLVNIACVMAFVGVWIEKGMGLIVPAFIPTPLGEIVEYSITHHEWMICFGIWAVGALAFTLILKIAIPIECGQLRAGEKANSR
ncbi:hypothetical protein ACFL35_11785 [Candidatus Riflebacteria bacterium]